MKKTINEYKPKPNGKNGRQKDFQDAKSCYHFKMNGLK